MTDQQNSGQAPQSSSGGQAPQTGAGESFSQQVFGAPAEGSQSQAQSITLEGMKEGETPQAFAARVNAELKRARDEAASYRTQLREAKGEGTGTQQGQSQQAAGQQGNQNPDLAAVLARQKTLEDELKQERQARLQERTDSQLISALAAAGAHNPARARLMILPSEITPDASGQISDEAMASAIEKLKGEMPQIFGDTRGSGDGGAGNRGNNGAQDFNAQIRARAGVG